MKDTNDNLENIDTKKITYNSRSLNLRLAHAKLASCSRDLFILRLLTDITNHRYAAETKVGVRISQRLEAD
jgi:hypothetical protein